MPARNPKPKNKASGPPYSAAAVERRSKAQKILQVEAESKALDEELASLKPQAKPKVPTFTVIEPESDPEPESSRMAQQKPRAVPKSRIIMKSPTPEVKPKSAQEPAKPKQARRPVRKEKKPVPIPGLAKKAEKPDCPKLTEVAKAKDVKLEKADKEQKEISALIQNNETYDLVSRWKDALEKSKDMVKEDDTEIEDEGEDKELEESIKTLDEFKAERDRNKLRPKVQKKASPVQRGITRKRGRPPKSKPRSPIPRSPIPQPPESIEPPTTDENPMYKEPVFYMKGDAETRRMSQMIQRAEVVRQIAHEKQQLLEEFITKAERLQEEITILDAEASSIIENEVMKPTERRLFGDGKTIEQACRSSSTPPLATATPDDPYIIPASTSPSPEVKRMTVSKVTAVPKLAPIESSSSSAPEGDSDSDFNPFKKSKKKKQKTKHAGISPNTQSLTKERKSLMGPTNLASRFRRANRLNKPDRRVKATLKMKPETGKENDDEDLSDAEVARGMTNDKPLEDNEGITNRETYDDETEDDDSEDERERIALKESDKARVAEIVRRGPNIQRSRELGIPQYEDFIVTARQQRERDAARVHRQMNLEGSRQLGIPQWEDIRALEDAGLEIPEYDGTHTVDRPPPGIPVPTMARQPTYRLERQLALERPRLPAPGPLTYEDLAAADDPYEMARRVREVYDTHLANPDRASLNPPPGFGPRPPPGFPLQPSEASRIIMNSVRGVRQERVKKKKKEIDETIDDLQQFFRMDEYHGKKKPGEKN